MFQAFPKIPRLNREVVVTEKIDGTNACVYIPDDESGVYAQSRSRFIVPGDDNYGFAAWVAEHSAELAQLGPGHHFGEWWGRGINRGYGLTERRFSLFNVHRWGETRPACCDVVPVLARGDLQSAVSLADLHLRIKGSVAAPGYMNPEGYIVFHTAAQAMFKVTLVGDEKPKGK
jgi:hypothetical protein